MDLLLFDLGYTLAADRGVSEGSSGGSREPCPEAGIVIQERDDGGSYWVGGLRSPKVA